MFTDQQATAIEQGITTLTEAAQLLARIKERLRLGAHHPAPAALWAEIDRTAGDCRFAADVLARLLAGDWGDVDGGDKDDNFLDGLYLAEDFAAPAVRDVTPIDTEGT